MTGSDDFEIGRANSWQAHSQMHGHGVERWNPASQHCLPATKCEHTAVELDDFVARSRVEDHQLAMSRAHADEIIAEHGQAHDTARAQARVMTSAQHLCFRTCSLRMSAQDNPNRVLVAGSDGVVRVVPVFAARGHGAIAGQRIPAQRTRTQVEQFGIACSMAGYQHLSSFTLTC